MLKDISRHVALWMTATHLAPFTRYLCDSVANNCETALAKSEQERLNLPNRGSNTFVAAVAPWGYP